MAIREKKYFSISFYRIICIKIKSSNSIICQNINSPYTVYDIIIFLDSSANMVLSTNVLSTKYHSVNSPFVKLSFGEIFLRKMSYLSAKCPVGKMSFSKQFIR